MLKFHESSEPKISEHNKEYQNLTGRRSMDKNAILTDPRFAGITPFETKIWLSSPTMHGEELAYVKEAIETNRG